MCKKQIAKDDLRIGKMEQSENFDGMMKVVKKIAAIDWKRNARQQRNEFVISED